MARVMATQRSGAVTSFDSSRERTDDSNVNMDTSTTLQVGGQAVRSAHDENRLFSLYRRIFPANIDWTKTVILECDPTHSPYRDNDVLSWLETQSLQEKVPSSDSSASHTTSDSSAIPPVNLSVTQDPDECKPNEAIASRRTIARRFTTVNTRKPKSVKRQQPVGTAGDGKRIYNLRPARAIMCDDSLARMPTASETANTSSQHLTDLSLTSGDDSDADTIDFDSEPAYKPDPPVLPGIHESVKLSDAFCPLTEQTI